MKYRTDLALECMQMYDEDRKKNIKFEAGSTDVESNFNNIPGVKCIEENFDEDIKVTRIEITNEAGETILGKKKGNYITLEIDGIVDGKEGIKERAARALANELKNFIKFHYHLKVLVIGLGNDKVTPDALGPYSISKMKITRHLFIMYECDGDPEMANVSGFIPGVMGSTGIETAELIKQTVSIVDPEVVIIVDSLAARDIKRVNTTVQINDTGINPGSGM
ncbi:MAG: GPR endopeptidase, partial [Firmicutes bacterium]|nr:GPR endopeptidase [Bacillota bacterium]